jgi:LuxR family maltose regulon positive regulatory protein
MGDLLREHDDLVAAEHHLRQGLDLVPGMLTVDDELCAWGHIALARVRQARGEDAAALTTLDACADLARRRDFPAPLNAYLAAARAQLWLTQGNEAAATRWAEASGLDIDDTVDFPREAEYLALARVRIAQGRLPRAGWAVADARRLLGRLLAAADAGGRTGSVIEILTLQALALQAGDDLAGAVGVLERALALAEPEGYARLFLDEGAPMAGLLGQVIAAAPRGRQDEARRAPAAYARRLRAAFAPPDAATAPTRRAETPGLPEALTARELAVLRLIADGLANPEIAACLFVSVSTVKWYVNAIFGKLAVTSRTQAVARARALGLLA